MRTLFFDTETTGLPPKRGETGPWPRVIQLGFMFVVDNTETALFHCLIEPDGWEIPEEATRIHGITTEMCRQGGIPITDALLNFKLFADMAGGLVAHSYEFDSSILDKELMRLGFQAEMFSDVRQFCTMKATTEICRIQAVNSRGTYNKYPKLTEAYSHFTGRTMEADGFAAHSAIGDVQACRVIHDYIRAMPMEARVAGS